MIIIILILSSSIVAVLLINGYEIVNFAFNKVSEINEDKNAEKNAEKKVRLIDKRKFEKMVDEEAKKRIKNT